MRETDYDPTLDGFPKPLDLLAMNEHTLPNYNFQMIANFIGVKEYIPEQHLAAYIAKWRYHVASEMLKARRAHENSG